MTLLSLPHIASIKIKFHLGSIYAIVLTGKKEPFSYVVPVGGLTLLSGWLAIALL